MHTTFITQRALRLADFSPVPDEKMVGAAPEFFWDRRHQLLLHAFHCFVLGKTEPLRHAENVGVHSERRNMKSVTEHHVRRFAANARAAPAASRVQLAPRRGISPRAFSTP